jgi:ribose transport system permease protein
MTTQKRITPTVSAGERSESALQRLLGARELRILGVVLLAAILLRFTTPYFLTSSNMTAMMIGMVTDALIAITMTVVLISGGFDLSVGSVLAFSGIVVATLLQRKLGIPVAIVFTLLVGAAIGSINGLIITRAHVNPLITTLGMMSIISSAALIVSGGAPLASLPKSFFWLGQGRLGPVPVAVLLTIVLVIVADVLLRRAQWMRLVYYVGGNEQAAFLSGIAVSRVRLMAYISSGVMASVAGIISTSRLSSAFPLAGSGTEMRVISACVIGGCSLAGGEGSVLGSVLGVILVAIINNGLVLLKVPVYWQGIVTGSILIGTVAFDMLNQRRQR